MLWLAIAATALAWGAAPLVDKRILSNTSFARFLAVRTVALAVIFVAVEWVCHRSDARTATATPRSAWVASIALCAISTVAYTWGLKLTHDPAVYSAIVYPMGLSLVALFQAMAEPGDGRLRVRRVAGIALSCVACVLLVG